MLAGWEAPGSRDGSGEQRCKGRSRAAVAQDLGFEDKDSTWRREKGVRLLRQVTHRRAGGSVKEGAPLLWLQLHPTQWRGAEAAFGLA